MRNCRGEGGIGAVACRKALKLQGLRAKEEWSCMTESIRELAGVDVGPGRQWLSKVQGHVHVML